MKTTQMIASDFSKSAERSLVAMTELMEGQHVSMSVENPVFAMLSETIYDKLATVNYMRKFSSSVSKTAFMEYLEFLITLRVAYTTGGRISNNVRMVQEWTYPASFASVLPCIGVVLDHETGIQYIPELNSPVVISEVSDEKVMQYQRVSNLLKVCEGVIMSTEMPKTKEGDLEFMSFLVLDGIIKATSKVAHPVKALLRAVVAQSAVDHILGVKAFRVNYGSIEDMKYVVSNLA